MATFALIHGAGDVGWYWHLVAAELLDRGHDVVAPDLPSEVDSAGLAEYADTVVDAIGDRSDVVVVAQSFGGFIAPMVCQRTPVDLLVLLAGMIPCRARHRTTGGPTPTTYRPNASGTSTRADQQTTSPCFTTTSRQTWRPRHCGELAAGPPRP